MPTPSEAVIDFTELEARGEAGEQFEQLVRALLEALGVTVSFSGRGADEGCDLIAYEELQGKITGREKRRWLVWCRNNARSRASVGRKDLPHDVLGTCSQHEADGFLLATTTFPSTGAQKFLEGIQANLGNRLRTKCWVQFDIEKSVIENEAIFSQFFPDSFHRYKDRLENPNTVTEYQLQSIVQERYGESLAPQDLVPLLAQTLQWGLSDPAEVREIYEDERIEQVLSAMYQRLLGRELDPSGHLTWGYWLSRLGIERGERIVEDRICEFSEYHAHLRVEASKDR